MSPVPVEIIKKIESYKPKIQELIDKSEKGIPYSEEDVKLGQKIRKLYKTAKTYGMKSEQFTMLLIGKPIKLWGDTITVEKAKKMVEERFQALRELYEKWGEEEAIKHLDAEEKKVKEDLYSLIKVQYNVVE